MSERIKIVPYDTTLRDGVQAEDVTSNIGVKLAIASRLAEFGIPYIEGGFVGSNEEDDEFFKEAEGLNLWGSELVAFAKIAAVGSRVENDRSVEALLCVGTRVVTVVGKGSLYQAREILRTTGEENIRSIADTISFLKAQRRRVFFDAEHFFDGFLANSDYSLETLIAARDAGAEAIILCDTNGGRRTDQIAQATKAAKVVLGESVVLGIHVHNDAGLAVANTLAAVEAGAIQVQGTINGSGERTGNLNLCVFLTTAQLVYQMDIGDIDLTRINEVARFVELKNGVIIDPRTPYVGELAFTHTAGMHADGMMKRPDAYQSLDPALVGREARFVSTEQGGSANVIVFAKRFGYELQKGDLQVRTLVERMKKLGRMGDAQEFLLLYEVLDNGKLPFNLLNRVTMITSGKSNTSGGDQFEEESNSLALVTVEVDGEIRTAKGESSQGALDAYAAALKGAISDKFPEVTDVELMEYSVPKTRQVGTSAVVEVHITFGANGMRWTSIYRHADEQTANDRALEQGYQYYILQKRRGGI